jgi:hypothetical protein
MAAREQKSGRNLISRPLVAGRPQHLGFFVTRRNAANVSDGFGVDEVELALEYAVARYI